MTELTAEELIGKITVLYDIDIKGLRLMKRMLSLCRKEDLKLIGEFMNEIISLPQSDEESASIQTIKINTLEELSNRIRKELSGAGKNED